jgi:hypothetical protein
MAEPGAKLRIEQSSLNPKTTRVWLNDQDITGCLMGLSLVWGADTITEATITIGVRELECGAQTLVNLIATSRDPLLLEEAIRTLKRAKAELPDGLPE